MSCHRLSVFRNVAFVIVAFACGILGRDASAKAEETTTEAEETTTEAEHAPVQTEDTADQSKKTSVELRFVISSPSARWSVVDERSGIDAFHSRQSLYFGPGIGVRVFPKQPHHGVVVDLQSQAGAVDALNRGSKELDEAATDLDNGDIDSAQVHYDKASDSFDKASAILS